MKIYHSTNTNTIHANCEYLNGRWVKIKECVEDLVEKTDADESSIDIQELSWGRSMKNMTIITITKFKTIPEDAIKVNNFWKIV